MYIAFLWWHPTSASIPVNYIHILYIVASSNSSVIDWNLEDICKTYHYLAKTNHSKACTKKMILKMFYVWMKGKLSY